MDCPSCKAQNPSDKRYCGDCGSSLSPLAIDISNEVERVLREKFTDRHLVEYELTEKVVTRLETWVKLASWIFGVSVIILAISAAVLGVIGIKSFSDGIGKIDQASNSAVSQLKTQVASHADSLKRLADANSAQLDQQAKMIITATKQAGTQIGAQLRETEGRVKNLKSRLSSQEATDLENQEKLARIRQIATENPNTPIGSIDKSLIIPSYPGLDSIVNFQTLAIGSKGDNVTKLQNRLSTFGCYNGDATGTFDENTAKAVIRFKTARVRRNGAFISSLLPTIPQDATVDYFTWSQLFLSSTELLYPQICAGDADAKP
jgi:TolA-binding protein